MLVCTAKYQRSHMPSYRANTAPSSPYINHTMTGNLLLSAYTHRLHGCRVSMLERVQAADAGAHPEPTKARVRPDSSFMTFLMRRGAVKTWSRVCVTPCLQAQEFCSRD